MQYALVLLNFVGVYGTCKTCRCAVRCDNSRDLVCSLFTARLEEGSSSPAGGVKAYNCGKSRTLDFLHDNRLSVFCVIIGQLMLR